mgnify:CR=1 FL=1
MDTDRVLQFINAGFIFLGGFAQYKFSFNQPDHCGCDSGKDDGDLSRVLLMIRELIHAKTAGDKEQSNDAPKSSSDGNKAIFSQKTPIDGLRIR